jgi:hypothetical protein
LSAIRYFVKAFILLGLGIGFDGDEASAQSIEQIA